MSGHQSFKKTLAIIQESYTWYHIHHNVLEFIKKCSTCNATNPKFSISAEYFPMEKGTRPFEVVAMDLNSGLLKTKRGN